MVRRNICKINSYRVRFPVGASHFCVAFSNSIVIAFSSGCSSLSSSFFFSLLLVVTVYSL